MVPRTTVRSGLRSLATVVPGRSGRLGLFVLQQINNCAAPRVHTTPAAQRCGAPCPMERRAGRCCLLSNATRTRPIRTNWGYAPGGVDRRILFFTLTRTTSATLRGAPSLPRCPASVSAPDAGFPRPQTRPPRVRSRALCVQALSHKGAGRCCAPPLGQRARPPSSAPSL